MCRVGFFKHVSPDMLPPINCKFDHFFSGPQNEYSNTYFLKYKHLKRFHYREYANPKPFFNHDSLVMIRPCSEDGEGNSLISIFFYGYLYFKKLAITLWTHFTDKLSTLPKHVRIMMTVTHVWKPRAMHCRVIGNNHSPVSIPHRSDLWQTHEYLSKLSKLRKLINHYIAILITSELSVFTLRRFLSPVSIVWRDIRCFC